MLHFDAKSPAPRCLRMFMLEKGIELPTKLVDVFAGDNRQPDYLQLNPAGQTPALRLDNGFVLAESVAIAEYLEEKFPLPALIGETPEQRAETRQWWRRVELNITEFIHNAFHYAEGIERFRDRIPVAPDAAQGLKMVAQDRIAWLDGMMTKDEWLCGKRFTAADIWLYVWLDFGAVVNQDFDRTLPKLSRWFERVAARPSAEASRQLFA